MAAKRTLPQCGLFEAVAERASDGVGEWYLARRSGRADTGQLVAIQVFTGPTCARLKSLAPLLRQAAAAAAIRHPGLVGVIEVGSCDRGPYLATEHVAGISVAELVRLQATGSLTLTVRIVAGIVRHAAIALDVAHRAADPAGNSIGMVHAALTPARVQVTTDGSVKIAGLGTAYAQNWLIGAEVEDPIARARWLAPEQARGEPPVAASDQFSLGALAWELIAGRPLFAATDADHASQLVRSAPIAPLDEVQPATPAAISALVGRMLERDPAHRFESCAEVAETLAGFLLETGGSARSEIAELVQRCLAVNDAIAAPAAPVPERLPDDALSPAPELLPDDALSPAPELLPDDALSPVPEPLPDDALQPVIELVPELVPDADAPPAAADSVTYCMACGAEQPGDAKFCSECGRSFSGEVAVTAAPVAVANRSVARSVHAKNAACHACGVALDDDVSYCRRCGAPVVDDGSPSSGSLSRADAGSSAAEPPRQAGGSQREIEISSEFASSAAIEIEGDDKRPDSGYLESAFVGRSKELAALRTALEGARAGSTQRRLIVGGPGSGKTRLLHEIGALADRDFLVVQATAGRFGVPVAFDLFRQWVVGLCDRLGATPHTAEQLHHSSVAEACRWINRVVVPLPLQALLAQLFDGQPAEPCTDAGVHRLRAESALLCFFWLVARNQPICLLGDGLHQADVASLGLLDALTARLPESRLAVIASSDPGPTSQPVAASEVITLAPLDETEILQIAGSFLASGALPEGLVQALRAGCHGNPLLVTDHMRTLLRTQVLQFDGAGWRLMGAGEAARLPTGREMANSRLALLERATQRATAVAAVAGEVVSTPLVATVCGLPATDGQAAITEAMASGLLASRGPALQIGYFRHSVGRTYVLLGLDAAAVSKIHIALARQYQQEPQLPAAVAAELAVQHLRSGGALPEFAEPVVDLAHRLLQQGALVSARELLESALRTELAQLSSNARASVDQVAKLYRLGAAMTRIMAADHPGRAAALLAPLLQALPPQLAPLARAEALRARARAYMGCQQFHDAAAALDLALRGLPADASPPLIAVLQSERALALDAGGAPAKALELYRPAFETLTTAPLQPDERPDERADHLGVTSLRLGLLYARERQPGVAQQMLRQAATVAPLRLIEARLALAALASAGGDQAGADRALAEARDEAEERGDPWWMAQVYAALAKGDPNGAHDDTVRYLRRAVRYGSMSGQPAIVDEMRSLPAARTTDRSPAET